MSGVGPSVRDRKSCGARDAGVGCGECRDSQDIPAHLDATPFTPPTSDIYRWMSELQYN